MAQNDPLEIGIIGAGIAGLSAAIALKRAGHKVEVFEKNSFSNEGITLAIAPNAWLVYDRWGLDLRDVGGVETLQVRHVDGTTGKTSWQISMRDVYEKYGGRLMFLRHGDLHAGLVKHLEKTEGFPVKLNLQTDVTGIDCEKGTLTTANGSTFEKDLLVISNGLGCRFLNSITGIDCPLVDTGRSFFRYLVPIEGDDEPEIQVLFQDEIREICFFHDYELQTSVVTYLCEGGKTRAVNLFAPRIAAEEEGKADRSVRVSQKTLLNMTRSFTPSVQAMIRKAPKNGIFSYPLYVRDPLLKYVNGKALVIGDAAHVMKPQQGQGASISVEATGCLEIIFDGVGKDQVASRLKLFEKLRLGRNGPVHVFSNMSVGLDGYTWMTEKIKPFWNPKNPLPPPNSRPHSQPFKDFIYGYNVITETKKAIEEQRITA